MSNSPSWYADIEVGIFLIMSGKFVRQLLKTIVGRKFTNGDVSRIFVGHFIGDNQSLRLFRSLRICTMIKVW